MFVDGVRDFGGYSRDSFNLEQVEVAKGPTSALAGRGSTGGAINQVSKAPTVGAGPRRDDWRRQRRLPAQHDRHQPAHRGISPFRARPSASTRCGTTATCPAATSSTSERWGIAPSLAFGVGVADPRHRQLLPARSRTTSPSTGCPGCRSTPTRSWRRTRTRRRRSIRRNFYGLVARDYEKTDTDLAHGRSRTRLQRQLTAPQPDPLGPERPRLGDHRAALRQRQHQHGAQPAAPVARHGGSTSSRTRPTSPRASRPAGSGTQWPRASKCPREILGELRPLGAHRSDGRPVRPQSSRPLSPGRSCAPAPAPTARRTRSPRTRSTRSIWASTWN